MPAITTSHCVPSRVSILLYVEVGEEDGSQFTGKNSSLKQTLSAPWHLELDAAAVSQGYLSFIFPLSSLRNIPSSTMSVSRVLQPRAIRPQLSLRYQILRRNESTATKATPSNTAPPTPPKGFLRTHRRIRWIVTAALGGGALGTFFWQSIAPPKMPDFGTHEDGVLMADLNQRIDNDFKVKVLRGKCLGVTKQLRGAQAGWVEVVPRPATEDAPEAGEKKSMLASLQGAKGLGVERIFWDRGEHTMVAVVWFGGSLSGWPGVTHGGVIATQLAEKFALAESLASTPASVAAAAIPQRLPGTGNHAKMPLPKDPLDEPAQLSLSYVKPTYANDFYVVRVAPSAPIEEDPKHIVPSEPLGGHEYEATIETLDARVCVKAKAKFAPSNKLQRAEAQVKDTANASYESFKEWMWPSRQRSST